MKNSFLIGLLFFLLLSCEKSTIEKTPIDGVWVESIHKMDTLVFCKQVHLFELKRGTELRNGHLLPKYLSGTYSYEIVNDSISLVWMPSSCNSPNNFYFKVDSENDEMEIGNFFADSLNKDVILIFFKN